MALPIVRRRHFASDHAGSQIGSYATGTRS